MSEKEDRIARLSQRFKAHAGSRPKSDQKSRERQILYLDANLMERVDKAYRDVYHALYPKVINKSSFLEAILEYGLGNIEAIKSRLSETAETSETS